MTRLNIVAASRLSQVAFWRHTKLGTSLKRMFFDHSRVVASLACENAEGLAVVYNRAIQQAPDDDVLVFIHDDVFIDDFQLAHRLDDALQRFDVIGLAGNTRPDARHVAWSFWRDPSNGQLKWYDKSGLSGAVAHFDNQAELVSYYGRAPQECRLLDGCFLAAAAKTLRERGVRFDERFKFHFYDLDFCRTCVRASLRLGTWPIAVTHASGGRFGTPEWEAALRVYQGKWPAEGAI